MRKRAEPEHPVKRQVSFNLPLQVIEQLRNAALHFAGPPHFMTLASIAEEAMRRELDRMEAELNRGKPIPSYDQRLRAGRPITAGRK